MTEEFDRRVDEYRRFTAELIGEFASALEAGASAVTAQLIHLAKNIEKKDDK